jgi:hypothetical protein
MSTTEGVQNTIAIRQGRVDPSDIRLRLRLRLQLRLPRLVSY